MGGTQQSRDTGTSLYVWNTNTIIENYCVVLPPDVVVKEDHLLDVGELGSQHRPDLGLVLQPRDLVHLGPQLRPRLALRNLDTVLQQAQTQLLLHRVRQGHLDMEISISCIIFEQRLLLLNAITNLRS